VFAGQGYISAPIFLIYSKYGDCYILTCTEKPAIDGVKIQTAKPLFGKKSNGIYCFLLTLKRYMCPDSISNNKKVF
jgi:hypothetical protein